MIYDMRRGHIAGNIDLRNQTLMGYFKAPPTSVCERSLSSNGLTDFRFRWNLPGGGALKNNVAVTTWPRKRWIRVVWAYRLILHCITYWVWVHSHWLLRNADKILKYEAEAPLVATDVCDHYRMALGLRRIRNQKLWCTKNRQNSDCGLANSTHLTE